MPSRRLHKTDSRRGPRPAAPPRTPSSSSSRSPRRPPAIPKNATIRRQHVLCGKCPRRHGPYWYAFWKGPRGVRSAYIGSDQALARLFASWEPRARGRDPDEDLGELEDA